MSGLLPKPGATSIPESGVGVGAVFKVDLKQLGKNSVSTLKISAATRLAQRIVKWYSIKFMTLGVTLKR